MIFQNKGHHSIEGGRKRLFHRESMLVLGFGLEYLNWSKVVAWKMTVAEEDL